MQKLLLKDFEFHISPNTWNTAQDIAAAGGVKSLREVEPHFWVALVEANEESRYEIEIIITPQRVKAFTCECWSEGRRLICPHLAAGLLKIRQFREKKSEERKAKAAQKAIAETEKGRFTIQTVLGEASPEQLKEFVRDYARRDRDFLLALKTWFAAGQEDAGQQYRLLLDSAIPRAAAGKPVREPDFRRLRKMLDDFENQLVSANEQGNFRAVFNIGSAILQKIGPMLEKAEDNRRVALLHFCRLSFSKLVEAEGENLSPELRSAIWTLLFDLAEKNLFPRELERDWLRYLAAKAEDDDKFAQINAVFDRTPSPAPPFVLFLYLSALAIRGMEKAGLRVLEDYESKPAVIRDAIVHLYYMHDNRPEKGKAKPSRKSESPPGTAWWHAATLIGEHFLAKNIFNAGQRREIEDIVLHIAEKMGDRKRQLLYYRNRFAQGGNFDVFQKLKSTAGEKWPAELEKLLELLRKKGDRKSQAAVLAAENQIELLAAFIEAENDAELLQRYEGLFLERDVLFLKKRYAEILADYLREHFGRQAANHVRETLSGLLQKGQTALAREICDQLIADFPDRPSLSGELSELFPKSRRKSPVF